MTAENDTADFSAQQAIRVWTRRNSGTWSAADEANLQRWLAAAPEHRTAYEKVARLWSSLGQLDGRIARSLPEPRWNRRRLLGIAAAVVAVVCLPGGLVSYYWWNGTPTTWSSANGATRTISLADGTRIVLDAGSQIESRIGARARHVTLQRGEALLTVTHDAARPFEVTLGSGRITDLGTRFDVENIAGRARVAVLDGRVAVETSSGKVMLTAGSAGGFDGNGNLLPVQPIDNSVVLWTHGQRHFDADRLSDVLARLERYHAVMFHLTDPQLQELRVSGTFRTSDLPLFLRTLQTALPIESRWTDSRHVEISPRIEVRHRE
jgi:transmembrane sensor